MNSKRIHIWLLMLILASAASPSFAGHVIDFESPAWLGGQYFDTGNPLTNHDLGNNAGQAFVDHPNPSNLITFDAYYRNTRNSVGLTDGDFVGVTNDATVVGSFTSGNQGYRMSDPDGVMGLGFPYYSPVSYGSPQISIDIFIQETSWDASDAVRVQLEGYIGTNIFLVDLLNTTGQDIDNLGIEGSWMTLSIANFHQFEEVRLIVELDSDDDDESIYLDTYRFTATSVPSPGVMAVLVAAGIVPRRRRSSKA